MFQLLVTLGLIVSVVVFLATPVFNAWRSERSAEHESEQFFPEGGGKTSPFPNVFEEPSKYLSVIVPAYNEEERMPSMLDEMIGYLQERERDDSTFTWEIIIVNDGSKDRTGEVAMAYSNKYGTDSVRLLNLYRNNGKGGAVRKGMLRGRGELLLMADADGATRASDLGVVEKRLKAVNTTGYAVGVGSRAHLQEQAVSERKWYRNILMHGFHTLVYILCGGHGIQDTQCGFKLFTRDAARVLFQTLHIDRWAFDVELLLVASKLDFKLVEVAVNWTEIDGSKLNLFDATIQMLRDLFVIRVCYAFRLWKVSTYGTSLNLQNLAHRIG